MMQPDYIFNLKCIISLIISECDTKPKWAMTSHFYYRKIEINNMEISKLLYANCKNVNLYTIIENGMLVPPLTRFSDIILFSNFTSGAMYRHTHI